MNIPATSPRRSYNLSSIMRRAWTIYRENTTSNLKAVFSLCLEMAWAEAEGQNAFENSQKTIQAWKGLSPTEQVKLMTACIRKAAKNEIGYSTHDNYLQYDEVVAWSLRGHDFDGFISETWLRISTALSPEKLKAANEKRAQQFKRPITLISIIYNAARAAIAKVHYDDLKHGKADVRTVEDDKGIEHSYVETMASSPRYSTETAAIIRVDMSTFLNTRDPIDAEIVSGLWLGLTLREIAAHVNISHVAVKKRVDKMRSALHEALAA